MGSRFLVLIIIISILFFAIVPFAIVIIFSAIYLVGSEGVLSKAVVVLLVIMLGVSLVISLV